MRILLVEDEKTLADHVLQALRAKGYAVDHSENGRDGLFRAREYEYDLAIVDIGLPEIDGLTLVKTIREEGNVTPVLMLTARSHWKDKVEGLDAGADDYLAKPFVLGEFMARINALLRRAVGAASPVIELGVLKIDTARKEVSVSGEVIELTSYEYNTLEYLVMHKNKVISKTELTEHLYEQDYDRDSNTIEVFIRRLRKKLDPDGTLAPITTFRGQGYRIALD
jgi:two-component system, OmpR family, response regulator PhoP